MRWPSLRCRSRRFCSHALSHPCSPRDTTCSTQRHPLFTFVSVELRIAPTCLGGVEQQRLFYAAARFESVQGYCIEKTKAPHVERTLSAFESLDVGFSHTIQVAFVNQRHQAGQCRKSTWLARQAKKQAKAFGTHRLAPVQASSVGQGWRLHSQWPGSLRCWMRHGPASGPPQPRSDSRRGISGDLGPNTPRRQPNADRRSSVQLS